jgi:flagellar basal body P-ring protein FlgI
VIGEALAPVTNLAFASAYRNRRKEPERKPAPESLPVVRDICNLTLLARISIRRTRNTTLPESAAGACKSKSIHFAGAHLMKSLLQYVASFVILGLLLSAAAFAKDSHSGNVSLSDSIRIGSTQLAPGDYKVEWNGPPNNLKIDFLRHGKTVATAEGQIKDLPERAPYDAVILKNLNDNTKVLDEIEFGNRTEALQLAN